MRGIHSMKYLRGLTVVLALVWLSGGTVVWGQGFGGFGRQAVGGVSIDANGILHNAAVQDVDQLRVARQAALEPLPVGLAKANDLRKISLGRLERAISAVAAGQPLPDSIKFLAGLQRVRYVFVDPSSHDIVLAGFGEAWKVDGHGSVVGVTTGRPVLLLDDLTVALRAFLGPQPGPITCSIDPTPQGLERLRQLVGKLNGMGDPAATSEAVEQTLGPQQITIGGVPSTSHFARVLVAADYRLKRLGMKLESAPIAGLPSYLELVRGGGHGMQNMTPRWWLVPAYDALATDGQGLAWELRGGSVKCLTEETLFGDDGSRSQSTKVNPISQQWAKTFTSKYDELSLREPIFGELRNCMELAIVAALIVKEQLAARSGCPFEAWTQESRLPVESYETPKRTDTQVSLLRKGTSWVLGASGGVEIDPTSILSQSAHSEALTKARQATAAPADASRWWWD
jgi:hypothetical protein